MQTMSDILDETQKKTNKRPKSSSRFPKQMPSYIVAFAVNETYDDIATAQQMICNKRSLQSSTSSVSPALSSKTITIDRNSTPKIADYNYTESKNETKISCDEGAAVDERNEEVPNELAEIKDYLVVNNKAENDYNETESAVNLVESQKTFDLTKSESKMDPNESGNKDEFEAIKKPKVYVSKIPKRKRQNQYRVRNVDFKYKKTLRRAEKVCKKSAKLKESLYSNSVSKVVSRSSLLKSVPARVNIIDTIDSNPISDDENNNNSLHSSPSTTKKSFISYSSQDTLRRGSTSSRDEGMSSINTVSSVIKIPSQNKVPYKTEVINVSVAVAYNPNEVVSKTSEPYRPMYKENFISTETLVEPTHNMLTSGSNSSGGSQNNQNYLQPIKNNDSSDRTIKPNQTDDNTYVVGNSSEYDDSSTRSEDTLAPNSEMFMFAENLRPNFPIYETLAKKKSIERLPLLDTVINMGIFPEINPSTSSAVDFNNDLNNVFVTDNIGKLKKNPIHSIPFRGNEHLENVKETSKYVLKKSFEAENDIKALKNPNLPDESAIKAIIKDEEKTDCKLSSGEIGNYPSSMSELWDRLVMVVETAIGRLENSLADKVITEIRKTFPNFENNLITKGDILVDNEKGDLGLTNKEESEICTRKEVDEILQCDLVGNQVIDNIMLKLSVEGPETIIPGSSSKSFQKLKPKIFRDYFEVLKPPAVESVVEGKGDTITVSTALPSEEEEIRPFRCVKCFLSGPVTFLRENMLVISSVPAFFVALMFIYGLIVLVLKPW